MLNHQTGYMLLEGLISIVLFSIGIIGLALFQANMVKQTTHVQYRVEANNLLHAAMTEMETNPDNIKCFTTGDPCGNSWRGKVASLAGDDESNLRVTVDAKGIINIEIFWSLVVEKTMDNQPVWHSVKARFAPLMVKGAQG